MSHGVHIPLKMNALNIITARVSPSTSPAPTRNNSLGSLGLAVTSEDEDRRHDRGTAERTGSSGDEKARRASPADGRGYEHDERALRRSEASEDTPLLSESKEASGRAASATTATATTTSSSWSMLPKRLATTFINSLRWVLSTLVSPGVYLIACFYDEHGNFAPLRQLKRLFGIYGGNAHKLVLDAQLEDDSSLDEKDARPAATVSRGQGRGYGSVASMARPASSAYSSSAISSESESDGDLRRAGGSGGRGGSGASPSSSSSSPSSPHRPSRSSLQAAEEIAPARRSIRIKLHNEDALRQRKLRKAQAGGSVRGKSGGATGGNGTGNGGEPETTDISSQLKSPTSPVGALTKYPKTPAPPRPLIPRRQPSYLNIEPTMPAHQKTLILDLDETLIHSMSKGGRMSSGHMVEVRLNTAYQAVGGQTVLGPQHPILYYVHKRPHCDDFLRRVCKWYNLVVFTASVQEYADPVIDWLEQERKYFSARFYRQHCTFRQGAFIKDLSSVEPDLSKVMILDNSPLSYMFQQDNAIPIHGWTNDPTDKHLLHLVPLLEGLQYVSDVRAFLALRGGEDGQHMA